MLQVLGLADLATEHAGGTFEAIRYPHPVPNTLMLAAARYLADSKDRWLDRKYWANTLFDAPGEQPFADSASYRTWLAGNEAALQEKAAKESAAIERARQKMAGVEACSTAER